MKTLVGAGLLTVIVVSGGAVFTASKSDDDVLRQARDRAEIEELMWRYARALDSGDAATYASLYTPDGELSGHQCDDRPRSVEEVDCRHWSAP